MEIKLSGIILIVGNYGSGKTEVAINLAIGSRASGKHVQIADLDLVNPYFRTREVKDLFSDLSINIVLPPDQYLNADLPILSPAVAGMLRNPQEVTLIDVGGDDAGAIVLASLADALTDKNYRMLQVVNPLRPFNDSVEGCLAMRSKIETASKMQVNGLIGNANLINETNIEMIYSGHDFLKDVSQASSLPLELITVPAHLMPEIDTARVSCPMLPIKRQLVPPWEKPVPVATRP